MSHKHRLDDALQDDTERKKRVRLNPVCVEPINLITAAKVFMNVELTSALKKIKELKALSIPPPVDEKTVDWKLAQVYNGCAIVSGPCATYLPMHEKLSKARTSRFLTNITGSNNFMELIEDVKFSADTTMWLKLTETKEHTIATMRAIGTCVLVLDHITISQSSIDIILRQLRMMRAAYLSTETNKIGRFYIRVDHEYVSVPDLTVLYPDSKIKGLVKGDFILDLRRSIYCASDDDPRLLE